MFRGSMDVLGPDEEFGRTCAESRIIEEVDGIDYHLMCHTRTALDDLVGSLLWIARLARVVPASKDVGDVRAAWASRSGRCESKVHTEEVEKGFGE